MAERMPNALAGLLAAIVPLAIVVAWDTLEGQMPETALPPLVPVVFLFMACWALAALVLRRAQRPTLAGLIAGAVVALGMLVVAVPLAMQWGWPILALVWPLFAALAIGLGAVAGALCRPAQHDTGMTGKVLLGAGVVLLLAGVPFLAGTGFVAGAVFAVAALFFAVGIWALRPGQRDALDL